MNRSVGIRELKAKVSSVIRRVRQGETITVTDRNRPVALLVPVRAGAIDDILRELVQTGRLSWSGGKPRGVRRAVAIRGPSVAEAVVEDRR
ncbi:MAG: type II toxin-antitoxin system prevent-host-death family antitoxin [Planctomycetes bacterium]|nr:type II toxin-antitoxin system prevent-host-death family antitoxin [Planctomycetota bacterium]